MVKITHCKLSKNIKKLLEFFGLEVMAHSVATLFYKKIHQFIAHYLQNKSTERFDACIELDESYFGGIRKEKTGSRREK